MIVRLVSPHFRGRVKGGACLGLQHTFSSGKLTDIQVTEFDRSVTVHEDIGCFDIAVLDLELMKRQQSHGQLLHDGKRLFLLEVVFGLRTLLYLLGQVAIIEILHDDTENIAGIREEHLVERHYIG